MRAGFAQPQRRRLSKLAGRWSQTLGSVNRMRGNRYNLEEWEILITYMESNFSMRVVKYWKKLPREVVRSPSLEMFKTRLDIALGKLL